MSAIRKRINSTGRKRIPRDRISVTRLPVKPDEPLRAVATVRLRDRQELGAYLVQLLEPLGPVKLSADRSLWTWLALYWFDPICPPLAGGRKPDKSYRYVLSTDYRHYYRHLVRSPWQLVRDHGDNAKFLLLPPQDQPYPLRRHGEILEQLGGRQSALRSQPLIAEANRLYASRLTGRPRKGVSDNGRGSVRRLALVLRQIDLTFDVERMGMDN
ncbi:hypothetical protein CDQ92_15175 [Sphingopyxis bauzanensis]|uniref:Uncharacterized protein n=1 Tax=Sphingopyxis bauzanensis TaxID=651663 RepID=A0A246JSS6_9SPHN|nr:hypothetical protein [Sphingopyxis bauzanensis]OWQ96067.1 hypothetical protein CDQ92_15175 [Sphingopyxis bauzanensis]GGJ52778.1 hypothetical protein GCM10011393_23760 [Sphingopyxis bauzanensis]